MNLPFSLKGLGADGRLRKQEKEYGRGFFLPCLSQPIRSVGYRTATQVGYFQQARHTRAAQLVSLEVTDSTYESIYLVTFILAGPVYNNALKNRAALLCRACVDEPTCVAVIYLTLRTGCERYGIKNPLPFPFSQRSHVGNLRQTLQGKGVIHKRVETAGVYPLVRPRGVSATPR